MTTFLIVLGALLVTNFLLLQFSCNDPKHLKKNRKFLPVSILYYLFLYLIVYSGFPF